jgi:hypothetical protein
MMRKGDPMSKIGVGVGEDFPVDDGDGKKAEAAQDAARNNAPDDDRAEFEAWKRRRDDERRAHDEARRRHDEWHARKSAFKEKMRAAARESFGNDDNWRRYGDSYVWRPHFWPIGAFGIGIALLVFAIPVLLIVLVFSLISAAFKAPFIILALFAMATLIFVFGRHRHHGHRYHYGDGRYYSDDDIETPPRGASPRAPQPPQQNAAATVAPPPSNGK